MARKKKNNIVSYGDYKKENGQVVSYGQYKQDKAKSDQMRNYLNTLKARKEEEQKRQQQQETTRFWRESNAYYNSQAGDQPGMAYAAKMIHDTPGAAEKEKTRSLINQTRAERYNKDNYYRNLSQNLKYSNNGDQGWLAYAAKQMHDTKGAEERERQREQNRRKQYEEYQKWLKEYTEAQSKENKEYSAEMARMGRPEIAYARKAINDTPMSESARERYGTGADGKIMQFYDFLSELGKANSAEQKLRRTNTNGATHQGWEEVKQNYGQLSNDYNLTPDLYAQIRRDDQEKIASGAYDQGTDPWRMTTEGRSAYIDEMYAKANDARKKADAMGTEYGKGSVKWNPEMKWGTIFDWIEELDNGKLENEYKAAPDAIGRNMARDRINERQDSYESRKNEALKNAADYINISYDRELGTKAENREMMRAVFYDSIMPDTYEERVSSMTDEEKQMLDLLLDNAIKEASGEGESITYEDWFQGRKTLLETAEAYEKNAKEAEDVNRYYQNYGEMARWTQMGADGEYDPSLVNVTKGNGERKKGILGQYIPQIYTTYVVHGNKTDEAYFWMNFNPDPDDFGLDVYNDPNYLHRERFATDEMRRTFNAKYKYDKENGTDTAGAFLAGIEPYLNHCMTEYSDWWIRNRAETPVTGINARVETLLTQPVGGLIGTIGTAAGALGLESAKDPNSAWYYLTKQTRTTREEQNKDAEEWMVQNFGEFWQGKTEFLLNVIDSVADNIVAMGAGGIAGGAVGEAQRIDAAMLTIQLIMSSEATSNTMLQKLEQGTSPDEAAIYAIGDGIIEWVTERVTLENLLRPDVRGMLGNKKALMAYLGKATLAEGSEEINADLLNWGLDYILSMAFAHETELKKRYRELITSGMDPTEASAQVLQEKFEQIGLSGLAGAISGFALSEGRVALNAVNQFRTGAAVKNTGNLNNMINIGLQQQDGTISRENAQALQEKVNRGKRAGNIETGRLVDSLTYETNEGIALKESRARTDSIYNELISHNVNEESARELSEIINNAIEKGGLKALKKSERSWIENDPAAMAAYNNHINDQATIAGYKMDAAQRASGELNTQMAMTSMFMENNRKARSEEYTGSRYTIKENDTDYKSAEGEQVQGPRGIIVYDNDTVKHARLDGLTYDKNDNNRLKYYVSIDGKQMLVTADQIRTTNPGIAAVIENQTDNPQFYSMEYANRMIQDMSETEAKDMPGQYMMDAMLIRLAAAQQNDRIQVKIPAEIANRLYQLARDEFSRKDQESLENRRRNAHKPGEGTAKFKNGVKFGTAEFDTEIDKLNLTSEQKDDIRQIAALSVATGTDVMFVDNDYIEELAKKNKKYAQFEGKAQTLYGEETGNAILINVEGQNRARNLQTGELEDIGQHNIGVTYGHEFLHWLKRNNLEGYNRIAKYVFDTQRKNMSARGLNQAIMDYMDNFGYTLDEAIEEYVADSCDSIFTNKDVLNHIQNTNKTLFGQVKTFIKDLMARVRNAMVRMYPSMSEASRRMMNTNMRELGRMVNLAWDDVTGPETKTGEVTAEEISKMSMAQVDDGYMDAVQAEDNALMRLYLDETAERNGFEKQIWYHGTRMFGFTKFKMGYVGNAIYLTKDSDIAKYYGYYRNQEEHGTRNISEASFNVDKLSEMSDEELIRLGKQYLGKERGEIRSIKPDGKGNYTVETYYADFDDTTKITYDKKTFLFNLEQAVRFEKNVQDAQGIYQFYVKPGNQYVLDVENHDYDDIQITGQQINEDTGRTRFDTHQIARWAKAHGYDSVWLKNIHVNKSDYSDYMIIFDNKSVKSADLITYDDNGEIIKPSERFNTEEADFRWSRAMMDIDYMAAVANKNIETAQNMVNEAAERAGYMTRLLYHGTRAFGFTEFNTNGSGGMIFTATNRRIAETYSGETGRSKISDRVTTDANYLHGNDLLDEAKKVIRKYNDYSLATQEQRKTALNDAIDMLTESVNEIRAYINSHRSNLSDMEIKMANRTISDLEAISKAKTTIEAAQAWDKYDAGLWSLKWENEDMLFEMLNDEVSKKIYSAKNKLTDFLSDEDIYIEDHYGNDRVLEKQLAMEVNAENHKGVYELYGKQGNQLVMDADGANWNNLVPPEEFNLYGIQRTRDIAEAAKANGYDSVLIKNVRDFGGETAYRGTSDVYIFFDANQLKSADPVTYDDQENVIPLSERFNQEQDDIRFSKYNALGLDEISKEQMNNIKTRGDVIAQTESDLINFIKTARADKTNSYQKTAYVGTISESARNILINDTGMPDLFKNGEYIFGIRADDVRHYDKHFTTESDIAQSIIDIFGMLMDHDSATATIMKNGKIKIEIKKGNNSIELLAVTEYSKSKRAATIKTAYLTKGNIENWRQLNRVVTLSSLRNSTRSHLHNQTITQNINNGNIKWSRAQNETDPRQTELSKAWQDARDEMNELKEQLREMKPEANAWVKKLSEAMKNGTQDEMMPEYKEWEKGYVELSNAAAEAEQRYKDAYKAWEDYVEKRDVAEERAEIEKSGLTEAEFRRKQAADEFGYTTDFREAGYLLPNGKMLNFTGSKGQHYGMRGEDHRGIGRIYASSKYQGSEAMMQFMRDGNIRVMAETPGVDLISTIEPTAAQYDMIRNMARRFASEHYFNVDLTDERGNSVDSIEYDGRVDPNKVVNDIKYFYKTGSVPMQSVVNQFHYSRWTESAMDVNYWMEHATPSMVQTEDERALIDAYRGKRISMSLSLKKQMDYKAKIRQLEGKAELTTEQKSELTALQNKLDIEQKKMARLEEEILQITRTDGWAGAMYQHNMVFRDYIEGKTQEQVRQTVDEMLKKVESTQEQIRKDTESLKQLAQAQAVKTMRSFMGKTSVSKMASNLRSAYNSSLNKSEIEDRLAEISLKMASNKDVTSDIELLAQDLISKMRGVTDENLQYLRGVTFNIGESILDEYIAEQGLLNEVRKNDKESDDAVLKRARRVAMQRMRNDLKGSGIKLIAEGKSRFREQWNDLRDKNGSLRDLSEYANEIDAWNDVLSDISDYIDNSRGEKQNEIDFDEVTAMVRACAANVTTYLSGDPEARAQITNLMKQISELSQRTEKTATDMDALDEQLSDVIQAGQRAKGMATVLERDVNEAIKYYNTTARVAAENERNKVRKALIKQLRGETAQKLLKQQEEFRERMANDKKTRELVQDNQALRRKISTVATRMANRIFAETDQKNVPEETKALVRQVLDMLSAHDEFFRRVTFWDGQEIDNVRQRLQRMMANYGQFNMDSDMDWLVIKAADPADNDYSAYDRVIADLMNIESGLLEYRNAEGQGRISLQDRKNALEKVQESISEIWSVIQARSAAEINGRMWQVYELAEMMRDQFANSRFKGERTGFGSRARTAAAGAINWGNLTPEYFFKNLRNRAMNLLHDGLKAGENRNGLEANKAKARMAEIAAKHGFATWDGQEQHQVKTRSGEVTMTTEQIMALYATWLRESNQMRPEDTAHLLHGGFVLAENEKKNGLPGREKKAVRPIRMSESQLNSLGNYLTDEQKAFVQDVVEYMSGELAELGNEASMQMYGIRKFTEKYYFPIKSWGGVLNSRSDAGIRNSNENRAAQQGFSKRIKNNASNAIEISDFTPTAVKHITGMIGYNTIGPAIENMNKVLNQQLVYGEIRQTESGEEEDDTYKRNMRAAFQEAYGKQAADYLATFMKDMNGGITTERTAFDKLLSIFKKNAVAGSLSVAAQQPLSYIRAATMINPKYLAAAISPAYWKGSYAEMMKYSGIAVIKEMGKFDMNFGQTMQEWIMPEGMESKARRAWNGITNAMTVLPSKMDAMTWTRMWSAVKMEQMALNKDMDYTSDEFMEKVAERFNEIMRQTQVYDSVMTKSQNMRSNHWYMKSITSFMAEPTLSLNVLADAWQNIGAAGGKRRAIKALVTFLLSAAAQAGVKAFFGTGRSPDKKKNREENFLNKFGYNLLSEINPFGLIPGYNDMVEVLTEGELKDDAMGVMGKAVNVFDKIFQMATKGTGNKGLYRDLEDSIGQLLQLATDIPAKNLMRDFRAMVNFFSNGAAQDFTGDTYANRPTSSAVLKYQMLDTLMTEDLIGMINARLGEAGYKTDAKYYYPRIYEAEKAGNQAAADEMKEYVTLKSTAQDPEKSMNEALRKLYNADSSLTTEEKLKKGKQYGLKDTTGFILDEYRNGKICRQDAERLYRQEKPTAKDKDIMEAFDKQDWAKAGNDVTNYSNYTPLYTAIGNNKAAEIQDAVKHMVKGGYKAEDIRKQLGTKYKAEYLNATGAEKTKLLDALTKAYKATGLTADEALKIINGWKKKN